MVAGKANNTKRVFSPNKISIKLSLPLKHLFEVQVNFFVGRFGFISTPSWRNIHM